MPGAAGQEQGDINPRLGQGQQRHRELSRQKRDFTIQVLRTKRQAWGRSLTVRKGGIKDDPKISGLRGGNATKVCYDRRTQYFGKYRVSSVSVGLCWLWDTGEEGHRNIQEQIKWSLERSRVSAGGDLEVRSVWNPRQLNSQKREEPLQ